VFAIHLLGRLVIFGPMKADWFEMKEIRKRRLADAVWIPLRVEEPLIAEGKYGYPGYRYEFFGLGSLAVPVAKREAARKLGWNEIGISQDHGVWVTKELYKPADVFRYDEHEDLGIELAMIQGFNGIERRRWHLNQDLVFALGLLLEGDNWVRPSEDYTAVARLRRDAQGDPVALEIKNEYLRDYLCARGCFLRTTWYRTRNTIVVDPADAGSPKGKRESDGTGRFELRISPVLEGGHGDGTFAVVHVARTDVDPEEDVPVPGPETNDNVESKRRKGKTYFTVEGEVWRVEDIEPGANSPRVRSDPVVTGISYIVDASGAKLTSEQLDDQDQSRWLWFDPSVILDLLKRRGTGFKWYTQETGGVGRGPGLLTHFGLNTVGFVTVYAHDIATLDVWQQRIWSGHNIAPEGGVSKELLSAQMRGVVAESTAPERELDKLLAMLDPLFVAAIGSPLFRLHTGIETLSKSVSRFRALEPHGLFALAKDIMRLIADRIDVDPLQRIALPPAKEKWGSLKSLEKYLSTLVTPEEARKVMGPLFGVYELRLADAHLAANDLENSFRLAGIDPHALPLKQGYSLIYSTAEAMWRVGDIVHRHVRGRQEAAEAQRNK
jgi:hypothetical protein